MDVPGAIRSGLRRAKKHIKYSGYSRFCPVCKRHSSKFEDFGVIPRKDALCIWCGSLERHRLTWLFLKRKTDFFSAAGKHVLHIAPEPCFEQIFRKMLKERYITADLLRNDVDVRMNIEEITYPEQTFDVIYCSHVLEHVPDDRRAMNELCRVLKRDGWAVILVPITANETFEDPSITDPQDRLRVFGQKNHVRRYGPDYIQRLRSAGFLVRHTLASEFLTPKEIEKMGISNEAGDIYYCEKSRSHEDLCNSTRPPCFPDCLGNAR